MSTTELTADEALNKVKAEIDQQLQKLTWTIDEYWGNQPAPCRNWAVVGSLNHVSESLNVIQNFIGINKQEGEKV